MRYKYKYSNTFIRDVKNRERKEIEAKENYIKKLGESRIKRETTYGTHRDLIIKGTEDRLNKKNVQLFDDISMNKSYSYGYYVRGSIYLAGEFAKGKYNQKEQRKFGRMDLINGVKEEHLVELNNYPDYIKGRIYQMGRNIYDYIILNDLEIESYISIISTVCPKFSDPEFIKGYYDEEILRKKYKKTKNLK